MHRDATIAGGSVAGLSAATTLARAPRLALIVEGGKPRKRFGSRSLALGAC